MKREWKSRKRSFPRFLEDHQRLIDAEQKRLDSLAEANVRVTTTGNILNVGLDPAGMSMQGTHWRRLVDCDKKLRCRDFFRIDRGQSMKGGTRVRVDGGFPSGLAS